MRRATLFLTATLALAAGCAPDASAPLSPDELTSEHARRLSPAGAPIVVPGFATPESAVHDEIADVYLVSNVNGHPQGLSNDGFISRIAPDGSLLDREWIQGGRDGVTLHAPTGMVLVGDVLYVADADAVRLFDRVTGAPLGAWPVPVTVEEGMVRGFLLNDVCAGPRGEIYLTQTGIDITPEFDILRTGQDAVYRFRNGTPVTVASGPDLMGPNGCWAVGANVFITPLLSNQVYRLNPSGKRFHVATLPAGGLDGIVRVGGFFYITSVFDGFVFRMTTGGAQVTPILEGLVSPADLGFDATRNRLLIPSLFGDVFTIQPLQ
ncbi:MAG: hypothetical protein H0X65_14865 [Gemmatimonadetes bacterium]|nr:hypothetical protein [Gemmatimonadota bacterium]